MLGKIQPKCTAWTTSNLYIGADNIPDPKKRILKIRMEAEEKYLNKIEDIDVQ